MTFARPPAADRPFGRWVGGDTALGLAGLATVLAVVEIVPRAGLVSAAYLPPTSRIAAALGTELRDPAFWTAVAETVRGWFTGLCIAMPLALALGLVIGSIPWLRELTASTIEFLRPIPSVALIPVAVLLFGTDLRSTLLLVVYASFWQMLVQVLAGVQDVDPVALDTSRVFGLSRLSRIRHLTWPTTLPFALTGLRLSASVALILAITAELIIGSPGLGSEIGAAQSGGAVATVYALVAVTGLLAVAVNVGARSLERRVLFWHGSVRRDVAA